MVYELLICLHTGYILELCECDRCDNRLFKELQPSIKKV